MITKEMIDQKLTETHEFEKQSFGLKYGPDFPQLAQVLAVSEKFESEVLIASMIGMMAGLSMKQDKEESERTGEELYKIMSRKSPLKEVLAHMLYVGYQLGKQAAEIEKLEEMRAS